MPQDILDKLNELPEEVQDYLYSDELIEANIEIGKKYKLSKEQKSAYFDILNQLFVKEILSDSLEGVLMKELKIEDDKTIADLANDIRQKILAPIADYLGGKVAEKVKEEKFTDLIDKAVKKFNLSLEDEKLRERFYEICGTFLNNARTKAQFKNTLKKKIKSGGMGFDGKIAEAVASFLGSYLRIKELEKKKEEVEEIAETQRIESLKTKDLEKEKPPTTPSAPLPPPVAPSIPSDEVGFESEEKEVEALKQKVEELKSAAPQITPAEEKASKALQEVNLSFPSSEQQERLKKIVEARIRNVRTATQTFEKLTSDIKSGGLGLSKEQADKTSLILNKYLEEGVKDLYKSKVKEVKEFEAKVKAQSQERKEKESARQQKGLEEKFQQLTKKQKNKKTKEKPLSKSLPSEKGGQEGFNNKEKKFINPPQPSFSKGGGHPPEPSILPKQRPIIEDIKYTPKLYGPVQEIGKMNLDDFRKLSSDPKEAILKIKDKLSLLREQSYKDYQAGTDAWKKSPVYNEYLKILNKSLESGTPLEELLKSSQTLNKNEFDAIIESKIE